MSYTLLFFLFFCILAVILVSIAVGWNFVEGQRRKKVQSLLPVLEGKTTSKVETTILRETKDGANPLETFEAGRQVTGYFRRLLQQAGLNWPVEQLLVTMAALGALGLFAGLKFNLLLIRPVSMLVFGAIGALLPLLYVRRKRKVRFDEFEKQFPEALDFLARSMRAGHAFSISLDMMGNESPEPLGQEFRALFNELNLGAPLDEAFDNLLLRVPLVDVRFFVSSVMLQRQTGGNLSEILVRLSFVIRERFRLRGQVKAASAHGRITAGILTTMPFVLMIALLFVAPGYLQGMARDSDGKYLILAALIAQVLGYLCIRKIVRIKI